MINFYFGIIITSAVSQYSSLKDTENNLCVYSFEMMNGKKYECIQTVNTGFRFNFMFQLTGFSYAYWSNTEGPTDLQHSRICINKISNQKYS